MSCMAAINRFKSMVFKTKPYASDFYLAHNVTNSFQISNGGKLYDQNMRRYEPVTIGTSILRTMDNIISLYVSLDSDSNMIKFSKRFGYIWEPYPEDFDVLDIMNWMTNNCHYYWYVDIFTIEELATINVCVYFKKESDAVLFRMMWW